MFFDGLIKVEHYTVLSSSVLYCTSQPTTLENRMRLLFCSDNTYFSCEHTDKKKHWSAEHTLRTILGLLLGGFYSLHHFYLYVVGLISCPLCCLCSVRVLCSIVFSFNPVWNLISPWGRANIDSTCRWFISVEKFVCPVLQHAPIHTLHPSPLFLTLKSSICGWEYSWWPRSFLRECMDGSLCLEPTLGSFVGW